MLLPFISVPILLLVFLLSLGIAVIAVVVSGIIYPTDDSIDTSLCAPTRIREKAAVPLAMDSDDDQVTSLVCFACFLVTQSTKKQFLRSPVCMQTRMI